MKKLAYILLAGAALLLLFFRYWKPATPDLSTVVVTRPSRPPTKGPVQTKPVVEPTIAALPTEPRKTIEEIWVERAIALPEKERTARILREELRLATAKSIVYLASVASLGLTEEQTDQLLALLISAQHIGFDEAGKRLASLNGKTQEEQASILSGEKTRIERQIRELVGEKAYQGHLADRSYLFPTRPYLTEFFGESHLRGHALNAQQLRAIEDLPRSIGANATNEALRTYPDPTTGLNWADEMIIQHLTGVLTPAQLDILREVHADRNLHNTARRINRTLAANSGKGGP